jgi:hypothetical protein
VITVRVPLYKFVDDPGGVQKDLEAAGIPVIRNGFLKRWLDPKTDECVFEYTPYAEACLPADGEPK